VCACIQVLENIDIGGPAALRAAAKNWGAVSTWVATDSVWQYVACIYPFEYVCVLHVLHLRATQENQVNTIYLKDPLSVNLLTHLCVCGESYVGVCGSHDLESRAVRCSSS
jgi:hypothetical protein